MMVTMLRRICAIDSQRARLLNGESSKVGVDMKRTNPTIIIKVPTIDPILMLVLRTKKRTPRRSRTNIFMLIHKGVIT